MTSYFNEMYQDGAVRAPYARLEDWMRTMPSEFRQMKQAEAEALFRRIGITFAVYTEGGDAERLYARLGWQRVGSIPDYALFPRGGLCATTYFYRAL